MGDYKKAVEIYTDAINRQTKIETPTQKLQVIHYVSAVMDSKNRSSHITLAVEDDVKSSSTYQSMEYFTVIIG